MAPIVIRVEESSQVAAARRAAADLSWRLHFDETTAGRLALVVTELATNLVKHGGGGEVLLRQVETSPDTVEVFALDRGPGMANVARCLEDGYSTAGSAGTGLGAVQRVASGFDVWSRPKSGAAVRIEIAPAGEARREAGFQIGGLAVPAAGETECGDAWSAERRPGSLTLLVVDGLGHGPAAAIAAQQAVQSFDGAPGVLPARRVEALNLALRATRGAAVAVAHIDAARKLVRFAGLGNIGAAIYAGESVRHLVSQHGTAGQGTRRVEEYMYPWDERAVLVMHSDGIATRHDLTTYPGLLERHPGLVAGVLYRDFGRGRDDATAVVARRAPA
ncbi:MAG: ATP-binding protein, partial [Candidatus Rokuibacteriota bacterium]